MGKGAVPLYSYWDGKKLTYVEARRAIYIPIYSKAVRDTPAFKYLQSEYEISQTVGDDIVLWDFDGYDHRALKMSFDEVIDNPNRKMGHAFVLAMMLEGIV